MARFHFGLVACVWLLGCAPDTATEDPNRNPAGGPGTKTAPLYVPGEVLVRTQAGVDLGSLLGDVLGQVQADMEKMFADIQKTLPPGVTLPDVPGLDAAREALANIHSVRLPAGMKVSDAITSLSMDSRVVWAEPNYLYAQAHVPADPHYDKQWAHKLTEIETAWDTTQGDAKIVVAVLDSGVAHTHPDLQANIWKDASGNPGRDFVDVDRAAYEAKGWTFHSGEDYIEEDGDPSDFNGHGTHCAGIIAAAENGAGVVGACPKCRIMALRASFEATSPQGVRTGFYSNKAIVKGLHYAADNGAHVISMSFGGYQSSQAQEDAINYARQKGLVLIAAAGNDNTGQKFYPAAQDGVLAVGATDKSDMRASYSNYGAWVDLAAPGGDPNRDTMIFSTVPTSGGSLSDPSGYQATAGTSMATPYVAGLAGLLLSHKTLAESEVRALLVQAVDMHLADQPLGSGRVNARLLVQGGGSTPTPAPTCGDGNCEAGETEASCPADCKPPDTTPAPVCGDGKCEAGETEVSCPADCKPPDPDACPPGLADCDGKPGCEANLQIDTKNCGACGVTCASGQMCMSGACKSLFP